MNKIDYSVEESLRRYSRFGSILENRSLAPNGEAGLYMDARENIERNRDKIRVEDWNRVAKVDQLLMQNAAYVMERLMFDFVKFREEHHIPPTHWWWYLEAITVERTDETAQIARQELPQT